MGRRLVWFSRGAASAIAWQITRRKDPNCVAVYCATGAEHRDSKRFQDDWSRRMNSPVTTIRSAKFKDTWEVWEKRRYLAGINGAPCTGELKVAPRLEFQRPNDVHVFGYTADRADIERAKRLRANYFEMTIETPLIDAGLTKAAVLSMIESAGIDPPIMYKLGFQNNNCIPCPKATSAQYWALIRKEFPQEFKRMMDLSKDIGCRLTRIDGERVFLDEIPPDYPTTEPIVPSCDFLCQIAEMDE